MAEKNVVFANIVSTPTLNSWAQAYNAGKLFAVLSLRKDSEEGQSSEEEGLNAIGKKILNSLEQEFFTLETKDLRSIKGAIEITIQKIPQEVKSSFAIGAIVNNILYLFVLNKGRVNIKREDKIGTVIDGEKDSEKLKASSGYLKDGDIIILQTEQFSSLVSESTLSSALDHQSPSEISEILAPLVHGTEEGGAAAVIIEYKEDKETLQTEEEVTIEPEKEIINEDLPIYEEDSGSSFFKNFKEKFRFPKLRVNHSKKVYLTIAIVIFLILVSTIFLAVKKQEDAKTKAIFNQYYPEASKKYNDGQALIDLNQNLARDSFQTAQNLLRQGEAKLPKNSSEEKQTEDLLSKVDKALGSASGISNASAKEVNADSSKILAFEENNSGSYFVQDGKNIYFVDDKGVSLNDGSSSKTIIKNDSIWKEAGGLGVYFGNIYVLDKSDGILKFASGSYNQSAYFTGTAPSLVKAGSIAIDGSIWIIFANGNIAKFTKGKADSFNISGLSAKLSNPTRIYTNVDIDNVYVLDNGNSRIVVLGKDGSYKAQYQAGILKAAKDFDVQESAKKIFVLSDGKIYQIDLK